MTRRFWSIPGLMVSVALLGRADVATAQAKIAKEIIEQGVEQIFKRAGTEAAEELARIGGKQAVRELLKRGAAEGGESLVQRITAYGLEHGPVALRAVGRSPVKVVAALDGMAAELRPVALRALERNPAVLTSLAERYGGAALEAAVRHPGVGETIAQRLGREGIDATKELTTDQAIVVARHADEIAKLPGPQQAGILNRLKNTGGDAVAFLERHPKTLLTAAGVVAFIEAKDELLGPGDAPNGTGLGRAQGLIPRIWSDLLRLLSRPLIALATVITLLVAGWATIKLWEIWRRARNRVQLGEAKARTD